MSSSIEPHPYPINPRSPSPECPDSPRNIQYARSFDVTVTLSDVSEYAQDYLKINTQRLAVQGHIDRLLEEFDENITAAETERNPAKKAEFHDRIVSAFRRGYLDFCEFRRVERKLGMVHSAHFEKYFSKG